MNKCIFLDRDGVLNRDKVDYVYHIEDIFVPSGVKEGLKLLQKQGYLLIVITNQSGIAKGIYSREDVWDVHRFLEKEYDLQFNDLYFSPHHPSYNSASLTRKPDSLLIEKALAKYNIDPDNSWIIGDSFRDIKAGLKAGVKTLHLHNGKEQKASADAHFVATTFLEAAQHITTKD